MSHQSAPPKRPGWYRIVHTADWHLGKLLSDRSREEEHALFLLQLLKTVQDYAVDAVLVTGDVFDTANPSNSTLQQYYDFIAGLSKMRSCTFAVISGNHDSAAQLEAPRRPLQALNAYVYGYLQDDAASRILTLPPGRDPKVAVAMVPFLRDRDLRVGKAGENYDEIRTQIVAGIQRVYAETAAALPERGLRCPAIAAGHLTVLGTTASDSERDIHIGGLGAVSAEAFPRVFACVALGHLHRPQSVGDQGRVRYAGSPIPLSFGEAADVKQLRLIDVGPDGVEHSSLELPRLRRLARVCTTADGLADALARFDPQTAALRTWVEVVIQGSDAADDLNERARELAQGLDFDVLRVVRERSSTDGQIDTSAWSDDEAIDTLIDQPLGVFDELLSRRPRIDQAEVEQLRSAFLELLEVHQQLAGGHGS